MNKKLLKQVIKFRQNPNIFRFSDKKNPENINDNINENIRMQQQYNQERIDEKQLLVEQEKLQKIKDDYEKQQQEYRNKSIYDVGTANQYVNDQIKKFDWATYITAPYLPSKIREPYMAINYFNMELMRIPESTKESSLAMGKLEFWEDSVNQIFQDKPLKEPVSIALHDACKNNPISMRYIKNMVSIRKVEIQNKQVPDLAFLVSLSENIRSNMIYLNLQLLRIEFKDNQELKKCVELLSRCLGLLDYVRRIPFSLQKYRLYMPDDIMRKHNINIRNLWERIEGKPKDELFDVVLEVAAFAKKCLEEAKYHSKNLPPHAFRAMLHGVEAEYYLEYLEKVNFNVFDQGLNGTSYIQMPYRVFNAAKKQQFYLN